MTLGKLREATKYYSDNAELKIKLSGEVITDDDGKIDVKDISTFIRPRRGGDVEIITLGN